jgi:uncharacterized repeat protein (TIGR03803 family)
MTSCYFFLRRVSAVFALIVLSSCGGGGGGSGSAVGGGSAGSAVGAPYILASVFSFATGNVPSGFLPAGYNTMVVVSVQDDATGAPLTNAVVKANGNILSYSALSQDYEAAVLLDAGARMVVSVEVNGSSYGVSGNQIAAYPKITAPMPGSTVAPNTNSNVTWSSAPQVGSEFLLGVFDTDGNLVWPQALNGGLQTLPNADRNFTLPINSNSISPGNRLLLLGQFAVVNISNSAANSSLIFSGFDYVPIAVSNVPPTISHTIGGTLSGLGAGNQVTIENRATNYSESWTETLKISADGTFTFSKPLPNNTSYVIAISTPPEGKVCNVNNRVETSYSTVTDIFIACVTYSSLHSFGSIADGENPSSALIQAVDGNFYGTTSYGGIDGVGTIFKWDPTANVKTTLYSFKNNGVDGQKPMAAVTQGFDGIFYGTTKEGGTNNSGTIYMWNPETQTESVLYSFSRTNADGVSPLGALIQDSNGNFYGTTVWGGATGFGTLFEWNLKTKTATVLHSFGNGSDGYLPYTGLVKAKNGNFYGTTRGSPPPPPASQTVEVVELFMNGIHQ